jgi:transposase
MSEREMGRIEVLAEVLGGQLSVTSAAAVLALSARQVHRLLRRYGEGGAGALAHRARSRPANNRLGDDVREKALALIRARYQDFGPTLAAEMLTEHHGLRVSRETLRHWMVGAGLWLSRKQRRRFHPPRLRRERCGELVQIDGSEHRWFEERAGPCTLLVFIDDATGRLMQLRFAASESVFSYFDALQGYLEAHGRPIAFYSDKRSVFRVARPEAKGGQGMTQFGRALAELNIEILCASSSQAKGRVERVNRTLQDRLVKELRLAGVSDIAAGNEFLVGFMERFNTRFAIAPALSGDLHRPLNLAPERLREIMSWREQRYVSAQLTLSYDRKRIMLRESEVTRGLVGQYVDTYAFADGTLEVRWKELPLPYTAFDKDRRVTHAAVVENKRLSEALIIVQHLQGLLPPPRVKTNSEKNGYQRSGRKPGRPRGSPGRIRSTLTSPGPGSAHDQVDCRTSS